MICVGSATCNALRCAILQIPASKKVSRSRQHSIRSHESLQPFMTGLLDEAKNEYYGRPTYLLQMLDGALLVSDEHNGAIYRISATQKTAGR
jgi:glucose/arabinose dehydrogenase